jgi:signal transduction histidine kinase
VEPGAVQTRSQRALESQLEKPLVAGTLVSVSTVAQRVSVPAASATAGIFARRSTAAAVAIAGLLAAVGGGLLLATSGHLVDPIAYGVQIAVMIVGTVAAALFWLFRRPGNRLGFALLALAVATGVISLQGANQPLLHSIGASADSAVFLLVYYVVFAFADGRMGRFETAVLGAWILYFLTTILPWLLFSPVIAGGAPLAGCNAACPTNAFMIADRPNIAAPFGADASYGTIAIASATLACLLYRLTTATRPQRRAFLPVYTPAVLLTVPVLVFHGALTRHLDLGPRAISLAEWSLTFGWMALPYGFLLSIVLAAFFAAAALKKIVGKLVDNPSASRLRAILADALDDPSLELTFPVDRAGGFVDSSGKPVEPTPAAGRSATPIERNGNAVAVIVHDEALRTDPELVATAGQALLLAIENGRLMTELEATSAELRASRARVVAAGDAERRRIERDLHDGAQQHLVALRVRVGLAGELAEADPEVAQRLAGLGTELEEILQELRELAQGLDPPVLRQFGLREALASVSRRSAPRVSIEAAAIRRYPEDIESAVYFCCLEGLQNVGKHAGVDVRAVIRLWEDDDQLSFEIRDDGLGYDVERARSAGQGLANMSDRIAAVGGTLTFESTPGRGTSVRGSLPVSS